MTDGRATELLPAVPIGVVVVDAAVVESAVVESAVVEAETDAKLVAPALEAVSCPSPLALELELEKPLCGQGVASKYTAWHCDATFLL